MQVCGRGKHGNGEGSSLRMAALLRDWRMGACDSINTRQYGFGQLSTVAPLVVGMSLWASFIIQHIAGTSLLTTPRELEEEKRS